MMIVLTSTSFPSPPSFVSPLLIVMQYSSSSSFILFLDMDEYFVPYALKTMEDPKQVTHDAKKIKGDDHSKEGRDSDIQGGSDNPGLSTSHISSSSLLLSTSSEKAMFHWESIMSRQKLDSSDKFIKIARMDAQALHYCNTTSSFNMMNGNIANVQIPLASCLLLRESPKQNTKMIYRPGAGTLPSPISIVHGDGQLGENIYPISFSITITRRVMMVITIIMSILTSASPLCFLLFLFIYSSPSISFSLLSYTPFGNRIA
jgi:hypothetical protein